MKKLFFLSIIFFFALALAGFNPVKADSVVVNGSYTDTDTLSQADYDELQNTALLLKYLQNGGVIDVSNVSDGYSASDLVSDFGNFVKDVVGEVVDVINPFQSKFEYTPLGNAMLDNNIYKFLGMLPFYALEDSDTPTPSPDPDYNYYIDLINGSGFNFIRNKTNLGPYYGKYVWEIYPPELSSYFKRNHGQGSTSNTTWISAPITTVNIIGDDDSYSLLYTFNTQNTWNYITGANSITPTNNALLWNDNSVSVNEPVQPWTLTVEGTLQQVFADLSNNARNINIYVNGVPWSIVASAQSYSISIYNNSVPDIATNDYGYVHWVYDYEIFYRIDHIWDILQDILDNMGNGGQTIIRWPDVDDVIVDVDGQPAVAVKIYTPDTNIDEEYLSTYGPLIPVFIPLSTPVINDSDILLIAETPMSALPDDLLDVFGYIFIGSLFVCFIHRLLE